MGTEARRRQWDGFYCVVVLCVSFVFTIILIIEHIKRLINKFDSFVTYTYPVCQPPVHPLVMCDGLIDFIGLTGII